MRMRSWITGAVMAYGLGTIAAHAAVDVNAVPRTTGDLVALCSTPQGDPMQAAAVSFCHGFALGAVTVEIEHQQASRMPKLFCLPDPPPTVQQGIAAFVGWANASPARLAEPAADGLIRYLDETYPCSEPAVAPNRPARRRSTP